MEYFIPFNVPSLKNGKIKTSKGIFHSKTVKKYLSLLGIKSYSSSKKTVEEFKNKQNLFRIIFKDLIVDNFPVKIEFHFVRDSKREFDFNNANQIILDLLTAHNIIPDDSMSYVLPFPYQKDDKWYSYDKDKSGVYVKFNYVTDKKQF